ncbi:MAG: DUF6144 family protein [Bacteroidota bacterium]
MDRKQFLLKSAHTCLFCCSAVAGFGSVPPGHIPADDKLSSDLGKRMLDGAKSPDWRRAEKSLSWIRNMLDVMDEHLDEETKIKLLNACGRSCYLFAVGVADEKKPTAGEAEEYLAWLDVNGFKVERNKGMTVINFGWHGKQSPLGLSIKEGFCLCPIVENDLQGLSKSYCNCSAGYVKEIVERSTGRKVIRVEVVESIKRGGKDCRFRVELNNA